ncbi:MAG: OpgC family protein [Rhizobiaceae bacterium]
MQTQRDTRLDVFRALALLAIFIDHVPGTVFEYATLRNFGFADAAEAFVLISGIAVGLAYAPKFKPGHTLLPSLKIWRRAGVLYCAHIMTTVATLTIFCAASVIFHRPELLKLNNIAALIDEPAEAFVGVGLLGHQLGYNNILSMYAVLLLATPAILWLLNRSMLAALVGSSVLWLVAGWFQLAPPNYPEEGYWFLNPLSWQFLFVIGIAATVQVRKGGRLPSGAFWTGLSVTYLLGAFIWVYSPMWGQDGWRGLPLFLAGFDKTFLALPRLLDILALAYLLTQAPLLSNLARVSRNNPLAIFGKHSLPVFIFGTVLAMAGQVTKTFYGQNLLYDTMIVATGIAAQFALAYGLEWIARTSRGQASGPSGSMPTLVAAE